MNSKKRKKTEKVVFCSIKSKLKTVAVNSDVTYRLNEVAVLAHDIFKRGSLFLRAYCLWAKCFPPITVSTVRQCLNCVCSKYNRGARPKDNLLGEDMRTFWRVHFSRAYPDLIDGKALSMLKPYL